MVDEARLVETENGLVPEREGWFVVNAREAQWWHHDTFGSAVVFEGEPHPVWDDPGPPTGRTELHVPRRERSRRLPRARANASCSSKVKSVHSSSGISCIPLPGPNTCSSVPVTARA